jgi:hypothetical protein
MREIKIEEIVNDVKSNSWNRHMVPRLKSVDSYLHSETWEKGPQAYLEENYKLLNDKLITGCKSRDDDQFVRGQLVMLRDLINLRDQVRSILERPEPATPGRYTE